MDFSMSPRDQRYRSEHISPAVGELKSDFQVKSSQGIKNFVKSSHDQVKSG